MKTAFERCAAYMAKIAPAIEGSGGDDQTFIAACAPVKFGLGQDDAMKLLLEYNLRCQPPWKPKDLERKLKNAFRTAHPRAEYADDLAVKEFTATAVNGEATKKWPPLDEGRRAGIVETGFGVADLMDNSDDFPETSLDFLRVLFPGNPLVCCGLAANAFDTMPLEDWGDSLSLQQYVVPSPMSKIEGVTKDGKPSRHCLDNTGPRRYLVCEFDKGTADEQCAILRHLAGYAPMVMAVHSGGKSVHGWFSVADIGEPETAYFFRYAVSLGADPKMDLRSQFARMPQGTRYAKPLKLPQTVYYFRPERKRP